MFKPAMIVVAAALLSSPAFAQMSANPSTGQVVNPGGNAGTPGTRQQECNNISNDAARKTCLDNLNQSGPAGGGSTSSGSSPNLNTSPSTGSSGSRTGTGSSGSGTTR